MYTYSIARPAINANIYLIIALFFDVFAVKSRCICKVLTIKRVKSIADEYNYRPNSIAKSMVTKSTMTLGLILPDITNPYFPELAKGVERKGCELGYNILFLNSDEDSGRERDAFRTLEQKMVDGIIFIPSVNSLENKEILDKVQVVADWLEVWKQKMPRRKRYRSLWLGGM